MDSHSRTPAIRLALGSAFATVLLLALLPLSAAQPPDPECLALHDYDNENAVSPWCLLLCDDHDPGENWSADASCPLLCEVYDGGGAGECVPPCTEEDIKAWQADYPDYQMYEDDYHVYCPTECPANGTPMLRAGTTEPTYKVLVLCCPDEWEDVPFFPGQMGLLFGSLGATAAFAIVRRRK